MPDVLGYLADKGIPYKQATRHNVHTHCFFCGEDPSARGRLYINIDPDADPAALYTCFLCGEKGNLTTLKRHFGDPVGEQELDSLVRLEIMNAAAAYYHDELDGHPDVKAYLTGPDRGLTVETIAKHEIGYAPMDVTYDVATKGTFVRRPRRLYGHLRTAGYHPKDILATGLCQELNKGIVDALGGMVTLPYHTAGNCVAIRGRTWPHSPADFEAWHAERYEPPKNKYKTPGGTQARLFNTDAAWGATELVLCEGEFDALVVEQAGYPAMGVPGANAWQPEWDDYLTPMKRVWLVFDRDPAGEKGAAKLVERFAAKVRRVFLSPEGVKCDPTNWFQTHAPAEFADLLAEANKGGLLVTVADAIAEFREVQSQDGLTFGWESLDLAFRPGLQPAQLLVLLARTGAGKTVFLLNMMQRARMIPGQENLRFLFISLEQTRGEWWDRARRIYRFYHLDHTEQDAMKFWANNLMLVDRNRISENELRQVLDDYEYQMGVMPDLVMLDYIGYWARAFRGEAYERTSAAVMKLKEVIKEYRVPMIAPHQVSRSARDGEEFQADAARDSGAIEETADFILTMWRPEDAPGRTQEERDGVVNFKIAKSRHGGRGTELGMQWSPVSLVLLPELDPLRARAQHEVVWKRRYGNRTWEEIMLMHGRGDR
jgi:hypothetical protein